MSTSAEQTGDGTIQLLIDPESAFGLNTGITEVMVGFFFFR